MLYGKVTLHYFLKTCTYNDGKKQLSTTTCRMFVNYFGSSLAKAVRDGLIEQNPFLLLEAKEFAPQGVFHSGCGEAKWKGREYGATS